MTSAALFSGFRTLNKQEKDESLDYILAEKSAIQSVFDTCKQVRMANGYICPKCGNRAVKNGKTSDGKERFLCKFCKATFISTSGTPI